MSYKVNVQPSGHEFECDSTQTVLEAALKQGFAFPYGCRNGACGACAANVLEGQLAYGNGTPAFLADGDARALLCQACPTSDIRIEVQELGTAKNIQIKTLPARVHQLEKLASDVMRILLRLPATQRMPFVAGQYIDFLLKDGRRRSFSIANAPHNDEFIELHVRLVEGGYFTEFVFNELKENALLRIEGPYGAFSLNEGSQKPIIMVAGGTGFAPIKSLVEHMIHTNQQRQISLFWGARCSEGIYAPNEVAQWMDQLPGFEYVPALSEPKEQDNWRGPRGMVHDMVTAMHPDLSGHEVYMCGPPAMIDAGSKAFLARGLAEDSLYCDSFDFAPN